MTTAEHRLPTQELDRVTIRFAGDSGDGMQLTGTQFTRTAALYGIGAGWQLPVASFSGSVPVPSGDVERAADAIGQGRQVRGVARAEVVEHADVPAGAKFVSAPMPYFMRIVGGVGMHAVQWAKLRGVRNIIGIDVARKKLEFAKEFGATHVIDPINEDAVKTISEITGGKGV